MSDTSRRGFLQRAVASLASAGLGSCVLAAGRANSDGQQQQAGDSRRGDSSVALERSPMTLSFRLGSSQWLTDEQWTRVLELLGARRPAVDELSLFTHEMMGWFATTDEMARDAELMARRIREAATICIARVTWAIFLTLFMRLRISRTEAITYPVQLSGMS